MLSLGHILQAVNEVFCEWICLVSENGCNGNDRENIIGTKTILSLMEPSTKPSLHCSPFRNDIIACRGGGQLWSHYIKFP